MLKDGISKFDQKIEGVAYSGDIWYPCLFMHVVCACQQKEKYHTHLAVLYLDAVLKLLKDPSAKKEDLDISR